MIFRKEIFRSMGIVALGQLLCTAAAVGIFIWIGKYDRTVLLGGAAGAGLAVANFFFLSLFAERAADRAKGQDVTGGQKLIRLSYIGRMMGLLAVLIICAATGIFDPLMLVLPLVFTRPILTLAGFMKKKGGTAA